MGMEAAKKVQLNCLAWTEYRKKNGLDPLGMQVSSVNFYQKLLPGISNVTLRMRYYGLYAWLSWMYAQHTGDTNPDSWRRIVRRTEALYALIAWRRGSETGVAGVEWAEDKLKALKGKTIDFSEDAEIGTPNSYFKIKWGVYGQAYESQLFEIGILTDSPSHQIAVPDCAGEHLAKRFENELGDLSAPFFKAIRRGTVTLKDLDRFSRLSPAEIRNAGKERQFYETILFGSKDAQGNDLDRRITLLLLLKIAEHLGRQPRPEDIRWVLYAGKDTSGRAFKPGSEELKEQAQRWALYQVNDLCHFAYETLLKFTLDTLGNYAQGVPVSNLVSECAAGIIDVANAKSTSWNEFIDTLISPKNSNDQEHPYSERRLVEDISKVRRPTDLCPPEVAWKAIRLLGLIYKRQAAHPALMMKEFKEFNQEFQRSIFTEYEFLKRNASLPFDELIRHLIEERVIRRHLWVALRKFRQQGDYTFLIETDDGRVRLRGKDGPVFTNPRLGPAVRFLSDIHLIGEKGLTRRGAEVLSAS
jgi:hypothetical protein